MPTTTQVCPKCGNTVSISTVLGPMTGNLQRFTVDVVHDPGVMPPCDVNVDVRVIMGATAPTAESGSTVDESTTSGAPPAAS